MFAWYVRSSSSDADLIKVDMSTLCSRHTGSDNL